MPTLAAFGTQHFFFQVYFPFRSILARSDSKDDRVIAVETQLELATAKASEAENLWQDFERKLHLAEQGAEYLFFFVKYVQTETTQFVSVCLMFFDDRDIYVFFYKIKCFVKVNIDGSALKKYTN